MTRLCKRCASVMRSKRTMLSFAVREADEYGADLIDTPAGDALRDQLVGEMLRMASYDLQGICAKCCPRTGTVRLEIV